MGLRDRGNDDQQPVEDCRREDGKVVCEWEGENGEYGKAVAVPSEDGQATVIDDSFEGYEEDEIDEKLERIIKKASGRQPRGNNGSQGIHAKRQ